jgi:hypothetical protein
MIYFSCIRHAYLQFARSIGRGRKRIFSAGVTHRHQRRIDTKEKFRNAADAGSLSM